MGRHRFSGRAAIVPVAGEVTRLIVRHLEPVHVDPMLLERRRKFRGPRGDQLSGGGRLGSHIHPQHLAGQSDVNVQASELGGVKMQTG